MCTLQLVVMQVLTVLLSCVMLGRNVFKKSIAYEDVHHGYKRVSLGANLCPAYAVAHIPET